MIPSPLNLKAGVPPDARPHFPSEYSRKPGLIYWETRTPLNAHTHRNSCLNDPSAKVLQATHRYHFKGSLSPRAVAMKASGDFVAMCLDCSRFQGESCYIFHTANFQVRRRVVAMVVGLATIHGLPKLADSRALVGLQMMTL